MTHTEEEFMSELRELGEVKEDGNKLIINTIDSDKVKQVFRQHGMAFAIIASAIMKPRKPSKKPRVLWSFKEITYFGVPFKIRKTTKLTCKLGWTYKDPTGQISKSPRITSLPPDKKRLRLRITSKIGCPAMMRIVEVYTFPDYEMSTNLAFSEETPLSAVQHEVMARLHSAIRDQKEVRKEARYFMIVDKACVHNHPIWELTAPFFPRDGETLQCKSQYEKAKAQNWVIKPDVNGSINSLKEWVNVVNSKGDLVRFFKEIGTDGQSDGLTVNDFVLIFFNDAQIEALREFGKKCICVDCHVLNAFKNVLLTSLIVVDDVKYGFPVAFMFSNRVNATILEIFYQKIKAAFGGIVETDLLVSDIDEAYYNSWASVMTPPKIIVYSTWSVEKEWCENLALITDCSQQSLTYKNLTALLTERDESEFNVLLEDFCRWVVNNEKTREFGTYFIQNFGSTAIRWAACCRQELGIDFKRTLERMHNSLQQIILQGKDEKSLIQSVQELMHFCMYKTLERVHPKKRIHSVYETHQKSAKRLVGFQLEKDGEEWVWKFSDQIVARVAKFQPECRCIMKCIKCNGCAHMFICSCYWSSVYFNMCRHIHMLCLTLDLPSMYSALVENREKIVEAEKVVSNKDMDFLTGSTALPEGDDSLYGHSDNSAVAAVSSINPTQNDMSEYDQFAENRRRIANLMTAIETRLKNAEMQGEFEVVEELLQQVIPVADAYKAEVQSTVKVITLEGAKDVPYYKTPEPVSKKRRVDVQLYRRHDCVVIKNNPSGGIPETNLGAGLEMILGRQLADSEEMVYGEEVILDCHGMSEGASALVDEA